MNQLIKQRWLDALQSGLYPHATSNLRSSDGWCCLGVLTDLWVQDQNEKRRRNKKRLLRWRSLAENDFYACYALYEGRSKEPLCRYSTYLLPQVVRWAGLSKKELFRTNQPFIVRYDIVAESDMVGRHTLARANDVAKSFKPIIKLIEEQL